MKFLRHYLLTTWLTLNLANMRVRGKDRCFCTSWRVGCTTQRRLPITTAHWLTNDGQDMRQVLSNDSTWLHFVLHTTTKKEGGIEPGQTNIAAKYFCSVFETLFVLIAAETEYVDRHLGRLRAVPPRRCQTSALKQAKPARSFISSNSALKFISFHTLNLSNWKSVFK